MNTPNHFYTAFQLLRKREGVCVKELAARSGVSCNTIWRMERGGTISFGNYWCLVYWLGVDWLEIINLVRQLSDATPDTSKLP